MDIEDWREEIDSVDSEILKLINKRARMAMEVCALKNKSDLPIYDREREQRVIEHLCNENQGPLTCDSIIRIFRRIIQETRALQTSSVLQTQEKGNSLKG